MKISARITAAALAAAVGLFAAPRPAAADGAASTRNIIFGAAAIGGTLLILNHNKKVHQKYAEYDRRQAETQSQANQAEAAYESERSAYGHEAALVGEYQKEVAYQHAIVHEKDKQIGALEHSLQLAKATSGRERVAAFAQPARIRAAAPQHNAAPHLTVAREAVPAQVVSYGWGTY